MNYRCLLLIGCTLAAAQYACADEIAGDEESGQDALSSSPQAFNPADPRGSARRTFDAPSGVVETCIVPKHFTEEGFSDKDRKKEAKLCSVDWYAAPGTANVIPAGLQPKNNSTNPAVDVDELLDDNGAPLTRDVVESKSEAFASHRKAKKVGRIKTSLDGDRFGRTSSYAPSVIGYYATSRLLGDIAEITPAVWRTIDVARHERVADLGSQLPLPVSRIVKTLWATFLDTDRGGPKDKLSYTADGSQVYGAFYPSVGGDSKDKSIDTAAGIESSHQFKLLTTTAPVATLLHGSTSLKDSVATIVPMQGMAEMFVLDVVMLQADRLSGDNVSSIPFMYFTSPDGSLGRKAKKDFGSDDASQHPDAVEVNKLYLNDVDSGLNFASTTNALAGQEFAFLKRISHISPDLYARLRKLNGLVDDTGFQTFAKSEWLYTERDWARYQTMVHAVVQQLHDRCVAGSLFLDLDIQKHMKGTNFGPKEGCE
jgi:hypothetical protein